MALTGGFQHALWVLGAIALISLPAIFVLVRRDELASRRDRYGGARTATARRRRSDARARRDELTTTTRATQGDP